MCISIILLSPVMAQDEKKDKKRNKREERKQRINAIVKQEEEGVIKYRKHLAFGLKLVTDGYGAFVEVARAQSVKKGLLFQLDIAERKHPKEEKIEGFYNTANPLIYGKINFFYPVKLGVQQQFLLGNKGNKNGVSITANVGGGFLAGLLRPYKVEVIKNNEQAFVGYESEDSLLFLSPIAGPNFGTGWNELKFTPGGYLKSSVRFDYGKYNEMVSAIEVGISGEFYSKKIPQMIYQKQKQFFFSAYISLIFGKRK
jgi:hypothetical protein